VDNSLFKLQSEIRMKSTRDMNTWLTNTKSGSDKVAEVVEKAANGFVPGFVAGMVTGAGICRIMREAEGSFIPQTKMASEEVASFNAKTNATIPVVLATGTMFGVGNTVFNAFSAVSGLIDEEAIIQEVNEVKRNEPENPALVQISSVKRR
jgi:hypothetical protein